MDNRLVWLPGSDTAGLSMGTCMHNHTSTCCSHYSYMAALPQLQTPQSMILHKCHTFFPGVIRGVFVVDSRLSAKQKQQVCTHIGRAAEEAGDLLGEVTFASLPCVTNTLACTVTYVHCERVVWLACCWWLKDA